MKRRDLEASYLDSGVYTLGEAARLIQVGEQRLRRWVHGDPHRYGVRPLIKNQLPVLNDRIALSFINLIEALFIARFANYGVHVRSIRAMAEEAEDFLHSDHPFATDILFKTDGRDIIAEVAEKTGDKKLYNLRKHNWAFESVVGPSLKEAITYGLDRIARRWYPSKREAPHVVLNPVASFGQPVMADSGIPTRTLYDSYSAENRRADIVARWYEIDKSRVLEAVRFENAFARAA